MKPPEKIWIEYGEFSNEYGSWHIHKPDEQLRYGIEYVPAPVWHDAKEPPKEGDDYWVITRQGWKGCLNYFQGEWHQMNGPYFMMVVVDVVWYMPILPQPPEEK